MTESALAAADTSPEDQARAEAARAGVMNPDGFYLLERPG